MPRVSGALAAVIVTVMLYLVAVAAAAGGEVRPGAWRQKTSSGDKQIDPVIMEGVLFGGLGKGWRYEQSSSIALMFVPPQTPDKEDDNDANRAKRRRRRKRDVGVKLNRAAVVEAIPRDCEAVDESVDASSTALMHRWDAIKDSLLPSGSVVVRGTTIELKPRLDHPFLVFKPFSIKCKLPEDAAADPSLGRLPDLVFNVRAGPKPEMMFVDPFSGELLPSFIKPGKVRNSGGLSVTDSAVTVETGAFKDNTEQKLRSEGLNLTIEVSGDAFLHGESVERDAAVRESLLGRLRCRPLPCLHRLVPLGQNDDAAKPSAPNPLADKEETQAKTGSKFQPLQWPRSLFLQLLDDVEKSPLEDSHLGASVVRSKDVWMHPSGRYAGVAVAPNAMWRRGFDLLSADGAESLFEDLRGGSGPDQDRINAALQELDQQGYTVSLLPASKEDGSDLLTVKGTVGTLVSSPAPTGIPGRATTMWSPQLAPSPIVTPAVQDKTGAWVDPKGGRVVVSEACLLGVPDLHRRDPRDRSNLEPDPCTGHLLFRLTVTGLNGDKKDEFRRNEFAARFHDTQTQAFRRRGGADVSFVASMEEVAAFDEFLASTEGGFARFAEPQSDTRDLLAVHYCAYDNTRGEVMSLQQQDRVIVRRPERLPFDLTGAVTIQVSLQPSALFHQDEIRSPPMTVVLIPSEGLAYEAPPAAAAGHDEL